ncbi:MAG: AAA family ATPase [Chloroflexi bacterium]|nr:AAA family ATPase [Chloroflexota bacterium]
MKLAVTGKGGVGKTTLSSLLAGVYAAEGKHVIAIDANPDANFAMALGIPAEKAAALVPVAEMKDLIEERTGARPGQSGSYFKINPVVDDIPDRFSLSQGNIKLLVMGTVKEGGGGCLCPESAVIRSLLAHLLVRRSEVVIMDMDAGVEHLGRGTAQFVDAFLVVVEPGQRSVGTARAVQALAKGLGVRHVLVVGSKVRGESDRQFIRGSLPDMEVLGFIDYHPELAYADREGVGAYEAAPHAAEQVQQIKERLEAILAAGKK